MGVLESFEKNYQDLFSIFLLTIEKIPKYQIFDQNRKVFEIICCS